MKAPALERRRAVEPLDFERSVGELFKAGGRFVTLFMAQTPAPALTCVFALQGELVILHAPAGRDGAIISGELGDTWPAMRRAELELMCSEGCGSQDVRVRPITQPDPDLIDRRVSGPDVFVIPFGPVRSGVFEALQFQIETGGDDVPAVQTRLFFKHRAMESKFVGVSPEAGVHIAERVAGIASVAYGCAFSQAVERALGVVPPPRAQRWRAIYCELERIACHLDVIAKEAETTALYVGQARFQILKEQAQRLRARLTGSRFGRGAIVPGGVRAEGSLSTGHLRGAIDALERDLRRDRRLFLGTASMTDRLIGAGRLQRELVERYCAVGAVARGSGVSTDARHERPYGAYEHLGLRICTHREGDSMARVKVRFDELFESLRLIRQAADDLDRADGGLSAPVPQTGVGAACGWVEAPQGELVIWVEITDGAIRNVHIASPSFRNWALFDHAFPNDVLTDFAFIEHSFGLTVAGADR